MLNVGLFFAVLFAIAGVVCVASVRLLERFVHRPVPVRIGGGLISALVTGYWMLGAGWYIAAGLALLILAVALGALAGSWYLPRRADISGAGA